MNAKGAVRGARSTLAAALTSAAALSGQESVQLAGPTCDACAIELEPVVTLGAVDDPTGPTTRTRVAVDSRGRYYLAPLVNDGQIAVYDPGGRFLETIGRRGQGPGEFGYIWKVVVMEDDSLLVLHDGRCTVLSPGYVLVRTTRCPAQATDALPRPDGEIVVVAEVGTREAAGYPLHRIHGDTLLQSFGVANPERWLGASLLGFHLLASSGDSALWLAPRNRYGIQLWDLSGHLRRSLERQAAWFDEWEPWDALSLGAWMQALQEDHRGRLWVGVVVRERESNEPTRHRRAEQPLPQGINPAAHGVLEVIDPSRGLVLASRKLDHIVAGFVAPGLLYYPKEDIANGNLVVQVSRVWLREH